MTDKRELILARLVDVLDAVQSGMTVWRNAPTIDPDTRPSMVVYDGDEEANPSDPNQGGPRARRRVRMTPTVVILAQGPAESIGTSINELRAAVMHAVLTDETLLGYTINDSGVAYEGAQQIVEDGRRVEGAMALTFGLTYVLNTSDLAPVSA
jgi:hypothetical protein